jgi:DNA-binding XRE family transcriptional regulator
LVKGYPETPRTIGDHIRRRRLDLDLFQKNVAVTLGVNIETLKNWERGVGSPMIRHMPSIIKFLGYDPDPEAEAGNLPQWIAYARRRLGYTQEKLAETLDVDPTTIWRWERGDCPPPEPKLAELRRLLHSGSDQEQQSDAD